MTQLQSQKKPLRTLRLSGRGMTPMLWGMLAIAALMLLVLLAPQAIAPGNPLQTEGAKALQSPSLSHVFGTDSAGRDVYTRVVHGARLTLGTALIATLAASLVGGILGVLAASGPRWLAGLALRFSESALAIPEFLLALLILAIVGPSGLTVALAVGLAVLPGYTRVAVLSTRRVLVSEPVRAARVLGLSRGKLLLRHILPEALAPVAAVAIPGLAAAMLAIAGLTFLGLGVQAPDPDWGLMIAQGKSVIRRAWWVVVFPGLALTASAMYFGFAARVLTERRNLS